MYRSNMTHGSLVLQLIILASSGIFYFIQEFQNMYILFSNRFFSSFFGARCSFVCSWCDGSSDQSYMVDPLSYFSFQPVLHDWCNKCCGMCYPVCGMVHIKEPLLLIGKTNLCGSSGFPLLLSEWSFTICLTPYNHK